MKTGIELIAQERKEQIEKHGRTIQNDVDLNDDEQLRLAAKWLLTEGENGSFEESDMEAKPEAWHKDIWRKMLLITSLATYYKGLI